MRNSLLILLILVSNTGYASVIDSLKKVLNNTHGKNERAFIMLKLAGRYHAKQDGVSQLKYDSSIKYAADAYKIAKETGNDTLTMNALNQLGIGFSDKEMFDTALSFFNRAMQHAVRVNDRQRLVSYIANKGAVLRTLNRHYEAIDCYREGITIASAINDKANEGFLYRAISKTYGHVEDFVTAFEMAQRSIYICDSLKDYENLVNNYTSVAGMFVEQKKYYEGLKYFFVADSLLQRHKIGGQWWVQNKQNMAICYGRMGNHDKAIELQKICIQYYTTNGKNLKRTINSYINIGVSYAGKGDYAEAEKYFQLAHKMNDSLFKDTVVSVNIFTALAKMNLKTRRYDKALQHAQLSEQIANEQHFPMKERLMITALLSDVYAAKGDYANAYKHDKKYEHLQDSLFEKKQRERLAEAETRFRLSEKNRELDVLAKENELHKVEHQQLLIILGLGGLVVVVGAGGYRRSIRKNRQLRKQKQTIDDQLAQLEVATEIKSKFYANLSHELRTPVTLLTGMLEILKETTTATGKEKEKLDVAYNNSRKLQSMIEEILNLSRMEKHEPVLQKETVEIAPLLKRIVFAFESFIHKKRLTLEYADEGIKRVYVSIDEDKFEKVINNLIFNAIKFNRENGRVSISAYPSANGNFINIDVNDTGTGMSEKDLPHIFERFYQARSSGKQAEGLGIGLSLVKEFTELLGGSVTVTSKQGEGTTFSLQFPVVDIPAQVTTSADETAPLQPEAWEQFKDRQTVLLVEDNVEMRYYLKEVLGDKVNIAEAGHGRDALKWLENNTPDLIISDIMMPEMDGHEFIAQLKKSDTYKKIPVITLTALADSDNQLGMLRMGVDDYIVKPFNADELRIRVYNLLHNNAERKDFAAQLSEPDDIKPDSKEADEFRSRVTEFVLKQLKNTNVSVFDLAYELAMSERQLYRTAKLLTGCTPAQLIKEVKLQKAYELLVGGHVYKLEDVANRVGYEKASYFSLQFYERFGKRPSEFF